MRRPSPFLLHAVLIVLFTGVQVLAAQIESEAEKLAKTERLFSSFTADNGIKDGFLRYFDDHCIIFRPTAVNGKKWYTDHGSNKGILTWYPTYVEVNAAGRLGISTGPWEYRKSKPSDNPIAFGHFFSVWGKNEKGEWKVVLDAGNSYAKELITKEKKRIIQSHEQRRVDTKSEFKAIDTVERVLAENAESGNLYAAIAPVAAEDLRVYREEVFPTSTKSQSYDVLRRDSKKYDLHTIQLFVGTSGNLAYSYGIAVSSAKDTSNFVHVWRYEKGWKLIVDILSPVSQ